MIHAVSWIGTDGLIHTQSFPRKDQAQRYKEVLQDLGRIVLVDWVPVEPVRVVGR